MSQSPPDVAIFLRSLFGGGAERVYLNVAQGLINRGLKVDLLLARAEGLYLNQIPDGVQLVDLKSPQLFASVPKVARYLKEVRPKSFLTALHYPCEISLWAKRLAGVETPVIVTEHNTLSVEAKQIPQLSVRLSPFAARLFYPWADGIVAVSQGVANDLAKVAHLPVDRIQVIYNPVVSDAMFGRAKEPVDHPWFKPGEPPVILGVGRLYPQKDYPTLIRAVAEVRKQQPCRLVILGDGPERESLTTLIEELNLTEAVDLPGFVANPYAYMARAGVFVLSSAWEGLGNVLIEALALGTSVVSTDCESGPREILADGKYGILAPVGDSNALAAGILTTLKGGNPVTVDSQWLERFTLETCVQKYLRVLGLA
ncbi:MAG: glycosyltransferase [Leptolyngbyaceae cyanobacterium bins.59]|nr:glycosyltransferase [Leptolyngbyaceae cyanobacterium bins.59]